MKAILDSYCHQGRAVEFDGSLLTMTLTVNTRTRKNNKRGRFGIRKLIKTTKKITIN